MERVFFIYKMINYFFAYALPRGRCFAKSTRIGAATKIEE
jgi:hypothetical protein